MNVTSTDAYLVIKISNVICHSVSQGLNSSKYRRFYYTNIVLMLCLCFYLAASQKHKLKKGGSLKMLDSKPGVYTYYRPFLHKDKVILKKLLKGVQTKRPGEVQTALLRRHLLELTQSFMIPLERYMASLMPLQKNISPYKVSGLSCFFVSHIYHPVESLVVNSLGNSGV